MVLHSLWGVWPQCTNTSLSLNCNHCCLLRTLYQLPPQHTLQRFSHLRRPALQGSTDHKSSLVLYKGHFGSILILGNPLHAALGTVSQVTGRFVNQESLSGFRAPSFTTAIPV